MRDDKNTQKKSFLVSDRNQSNGSFKNLIFTLVNCFDFTDVVIKIAGIF